MSRRNTPHDAASLRILAKQLSKCAENVEKAAQLFKESGLKEPLSVAHQAPIESGIQAVPKMCREIKAKIEDYQSQGFL